jgi:alpha-1,6-mannosyltransferase
MDTSPTASRPAPRTLLALAGSGSVLLAASSWWVAATPVRFGRERPRPLSWFPAHGVVPFAVSYLGLATLCLAWLTAGRRLLAGDRAITAAFLRRFLTSATLPLLLAAPYGRDLWAYGAQGNLVAHGVDPYVRGPAAVPGAFTAEVSGRWLHSPAPYGPAWLRLSQAADWISGGHPTVAALLLRLPALAGLLLCAWALGELATRLHLHGRLGQALWLGIASPLTVVLGVGGGHNDLIMMGLAFAGIALACRPGALMLAGGAAVAALAVLVKSPAAIAVAFTVPIWLHANRSRHTESVPTENARITVAALTRAVSACAVALAGCAVALVGISVAGGLGTGWTRQVNSDAQWVSWLSLPSGIAMGVHAIDGTALKAVDATMRHCRTAGEVIAVLTLVALWLLAVRPATDARRVVAAFAAALGAAALLAPSVQPWYYCWGLALAGFVVGRRAAIVALAAVGLLFAVMITPDGFGLESGPWAPVVVAASLLVCWLALRERFSAADGHGADHARTEVRAHHRAELNDV